jgi:hypothetical protein
MTAVSTQSHLRRWMRISLVASASLIAALAFGEPTVTADNVPAPCSNSFTVMASSAVPGGDQKDRNGNGLVCAKFEDGNRLVGGPDDDIIA